MASPRLCPGSRGLLPAPPLLLLLLLLLLVGPRTAAGHGGKYSREKNEPELPPKRESGGEFRMEKLNQLWEKAQRATFLEQEVQVEVLVLTAAPRQAGPVLSLELLHRVPLQLSPVKLSELHADLKMQERDEFAWKKLKAEGLDEDGEKQAKLTRNLSVILAKYGLDGRKDARAVSSNSLSDATEDDSLEDPRLEKLWHKAKTSGKFSSEELDKLWREFQHHQEKVREYHVLLETLSRTEEIQENVISPFDTSRIKEDVLHSKHAELKDRLRGINQGYDRLRRVSHRGYGTQAEFEEPRVIDLWDLAKSANFTEKELESFREELKHFEAKIEKHNHYQKQLEISHQKLKHVESFGDREHVSRNKEKYAMLEEKTKELGYKVKKHLQDLSGRISRARHNEL
uniref:LDL receptor related protein associated protein 1 n=1 Tax=Canis lupus familiaris TaxID=9615 RepID=A0A8C0Q923_CANLF